SWAKSTGAGSAASILQQMATRAQATAIRMAGRVKLRGKVEGTIPSSRPDDFDHGNRMERHRRSRSGPNRLSRFGPLTHNVVQPLVTSDDSRDCLQRFAADIGLPQRGYRHVRTR